jgi:hypothetical protein
VPFTTSELQRIKAELGLNLLQTGADYWIGVSQALEQVVNQHIDAEVATTATIATPITAAAAPAPQSLTLASASQFSAGDRVFIDVDTRTENATIQSKSGSVIVVQLKRAHSGTVPVAKEGPIPLAREALRRILETKERLSETYGHGALKKVDEVEFYEVGGSAFGNLGQQVMHWRDELAAVLGVPNFWRVRRSGGAVSVY